MTQYIYVVHAGMYGSYSLAGVFDTEEKARQYIVDERLPLTVEHEVPISGGGYANVRDYDVYIQELELNPSGRLKYSRTIDIPSDYSKEGE